MAGYDDLTVIPRTTKRHGAEKAVLRRTRAERAARRRQLRQAVLAGATPADVAAQYGVSRDLVYRACGRGELRAAAVRRRRELAALVQRGMSPKDVARTKGVSLATVYRCLPRERREASSWLGESQSGGEGRRGK